MTPAFGRRILNTSSHLAAQRDSPLPVCCARKADRKKMEGKRMRFGVIALALIGFATAAEAQTAPPDLLGSWTMKGQ